MMRGISLILCIFLWILCAATTSQEIKDMQIKVYLNVQHELSKKNKDDLTTVLHKLKTINLDDYQTSENFLGNFINEITLKKLKLHKWPLIDITETIHTIKESVMQEIKKRINCNDIINRNAVVDRCKVYEGKTNACEKLFLNTNVLDQCGVCEGIDAFDLNGIMNRNAFVDLCGVCEGTAKACVDCKFNGIINRNAVVDLCGVCEGTAKACVDCKFNGIINRDAVVDRCGVCEGTAKACVDCNGIINRDAVVDLCGVCEGTNACECETGEDCLCSSECDGLDKDTCEDQKVCVWKKRDDNGGRKKYYALQEENTYEEKTNHKIEYEQERDEFRPCDEKSDHFDERECELENHSVYYENVFNTISGGHDIPEEELLEIYQIVQYNFDGLAEMDNEWLTSIMSAKKRFPNSTRSVRLTMMMIFVNLFLDMFLVHSRHAGFGDDDFSNPFEDWENQWDIKNYFIQTMMKVVFNIMRRKARSTHSEDILELREIFSDATQLVKMEEVNGRCKCGLKKRQYERIEEEKQRKNDDTNEENGRLEILVNKGKLPRHYAEWQYDLYCKQRLETEFHLKELSEKLQKERWLKIASIAKFKEKLSEKNEKLNEKQNELNHVRSEFSKEMSANAESILYIQEKMELANKYLEREAEGKRKHNLSLQEQTNNVVEEKTKKELQQKLTDNQYEDKVVELYKQLKELSNTKEKLEKILDDGYSTEGTLYCDVQVHPYHVSKELYDRSKTFIYKTVVKNGNFATINGFSSQLRSSMAVTLNIDEILVIMEIYTDGSNVVVLWRLDEDYTSRFNDNGFQNALENQYFNYNGLIDAMKVTKFRVIIENGNSTTISNFSSQLRSSMAVTLDINEELVSVEIKTDGSNVVVIWTLDKDYTPIINIKGFQNALGAQYFNYEGLVDAMNVAKFILPTRIIFNDDLNLKHFELLDDKKTAKYTIKESNTSEYNIFLKVAEESISIFPLRVYTTSVIIELLKDNHVQYRCEMKSDSNLEDTHINKNLTNQKFTCKDRDTKKTQKTSRTIPQLELRYDLKKELN